MSSIYIPPFVKAAIEKIPSEKLDFLLGGDEATRWQDLPGTQAQIRKVFAVARELGYTGREAIDEFDFLHMTRGELADLINRMEDDENAMAPGGNVCYAKELEQKNPKPNDKIKDDDTAPFDTTDYPSWNDMKKKYDKTKDLF